MKKKVLFSLLNNPLLPPPLLVKCFSFFFFLTLKISAFTLVLLNMKSLILKIYILFSYVLFSLFKPLQWTIRPCFLKDSRAHNRYLLKYNLVLTLWFLDCTPYFSKSLPSIYVYFIYGLVGLMVYLCILYLWSRWLDGPSMYTLSIV